MGFTSTENFNWDKEIDKRERDRKEKLSIVATQFIYKDRARKKTDKNLYRKSAVFITTVL